MPELLACSGDILHWRHALLYAGVDGLPNRCVQRIVFCRWGSFTISPKSCTLLMPAAAGAHGGAEAPAHQAATATLAAQPAANGALPKSAAAAAAGAAATGAGGERGGVADGIIAASGEPLAAAGSYHAA